MELAVTGKFVLDNKWNPPPLKPLHRGPDGATFVALGPNIDLQLDHLENPLDRLLNARISTSAGFSGLGDVERACSVFCTSNWCSAWALRARRPRVVAKIIGIMADEARFVLITQPKIRNAPGGRHESSPNRIEAGLVTFVLVEPGAVECAMCPGHNTGNVSVPGG